MAGPKNPEHATKLKNEFDNSVKEFLVANGNDPSPELVKKLQTILASDAFEVHSFELPRGLKVVEVDTLVQASDFLVMNTSAGTKVFVLPEFEVFDSAQILNDHARNSLVLVGHSAGQGARRAQVKVYALLPDDVQDETAKALPPILGEGIATFAPNHKDIVVDLSLFSVGVAQRLFKPQQPSIGRGEEERVKQNLIWKDGAYTSNLSNGKGALGALYAVARCMQAPADSDRFVNSLSPKALNFIKSNQIKLETPNFIVGQTESASKQHRTPTVSRLLLGPVGNSFRVELQKAGDGADAHVVASNIKRTDETIALSPKVKPPDMVAVTPPTTATPTPPATTTTTTTTLTPVQVANIDPGFNHHQATIVEKKTSAKKEQKTDMPIEDRIINSSKNQTLIQSSKDDSLKNAPSKETAKETAKAPTKTPDPTASTNDSKKVEIVETKSSAVRYPVDEVISPALEKTADSNINLRRGPSNGYRTLAHLKPGAKIEVIGKKDGWYKVRSGGTEGFIAMSTIDSKKSSSTSSTSTQSKPETVTTSSKSEQKSTKNSTTSAPVKTASSSTGKSSTPSSSSTSSKSSALRALQSPCRRA